MPAISQRDAGPASATDAGAPARQGPLTIPARVKICGVTRVEDAELAVGFGAWAIGMVFHDASPRSCSLERAREIAAALHRRTQLCGVYVNAPLERIEHDCDELALTLVQLHGDEGPAFCAEVARRTGARVIKAARVADAGDVRDLERFAVDFHLLDAAPAHGGGPRGGTGRTFDWRLLAARRSRVPLIVSGGLEPGNVVAAIAATRPWAVDTASGTEQAPGRKDPARLRAFIGAVAAAAPDAEGGAP